jgi:hypothetical protein
MTHDDHEKVEQDLLFAVLRGWEEIRSYMNPATSISLRGLNLRRTYPETEIVVECFHHPSRRTGSIRIAIWSDLIFGDRPMSPDNGAGIVLTNMMENAWDWGSRSWRPWPRTRR